MALSFCVLGSGSGGNCTLVRLSCGDRFRHVLIDAGLSPRTTAQRLGPLGVTVGEITDVLLTHTDHDHFHRGWLECEEADGWTWRGYRRHLRHVVRAGLSTRATASFSEAFDLGPSTRIEPVLLPHDELGATGYVVEHHGARLGYATDLGRVPRTLPKHFSGLSALAIESNYDRALQLASPRPAALKRRIMGGLGHLSNHQALDAVLAIADRGALRHVVLLHLSRQCNDSRLVRNLYAAAAPELLNRLTITSQHVPTPMLHVEPTRRGPQARGQQLNFLETLP